MCKLLSINREVLKSKKEILYNDSRGFYENREREISKWIRQSR